MTLPATTPPRLLSQAFAEAEMKRAQKEGYPQLGNLQAMAFIIVTVLIMSYTGIFGFVPILIFYAMWLPKFVYKGVFTSRPTKDLLLLAIFALICLCSALWSDYPMITFKGGLEFISMLVCTVIIARIVGIRAFVKGLMIGCLLSLLPLFITGSYSLGGLFGSKNQVGYIAEIAIFTTLLNMFSTRGIFYRSFCLFCLAFFGVCMLLSSSATSLVSLILTLGVCSVAYVLNKMPGGIRAPALIFTCLSGIALMFIVLNTNLEQSLLGSIGKDSSLTGRTYLWSEGIKTAMAKPFLGYGYGAFWVQGRTQAEHYWYEFDIESRMGFHFHNTFIQIFVDLGALGLVAISILMLTTCYRSIRYVLTHDTDLLGMFSLGLSCMFFIRAITEIDIGGPFALGPLLFFSIIPRLAIANPGPVNADSIQAPA
jgi:exopolysaccharide production protein ExoQ